MREFGESIMSLSRTLLAAAALLMGLGWVAADDKPNPQAVKKARQEARQKAKVEADAKAKADEDAKAKSDTEAKAKQEAAEVAKRKTTLKGDPAALAKLIDDEINKKLTSEKVPASPTADDAEFLRRVYLDLTGVIPPADRAAAFTDSKDRQKRAKLVDELLAGPGFGRHMADIWDNLLFTRTTENRAVQRDPLTKWLEEKFNSGMPWDMIVNDILTATGSQEENGASTYFLSTLTADKMVDSTTKLFMGVKMECAQCHNHPFTGWKQNEYWGMAAFFMKVRVAGNTKNAARGGTPEVNESGRGKQKNLPESAKTVPAKFFKGDEPKVSANEPLRPVLAKWLTSADNKYFSRAFANRVWGQLFGSGIINPIDDMHEERVASHPELLAELSKQFAAGGFDVKFLFRAICNSEAYQRTSKPAAGNEQDAVLFSHMNIKAFTPEQLYDSLVSVLGEPGGKGNPARGGGAGGKGAPRSPRDQFVAFFSTSDNAKATDYEEGIPQALRLMNHPYTSRGASTKARELTRGLAKEQAIEKLFLATVSRRPSSEETAKMLAYIAKADSADAAYSDILWVLLNSSEFTLNH
jgi:hypothetical protein